MRKLDELSISQARRIALEAQGFGRPRPSGRVNKGHLRRVFDDVGIVQIDAVNVLVRSHYLPFFSRLGPYDRALLDRLDGPKGEIVEYWGHEASFVPKETWPLLAWRMRDQNGWHLLRATAKANEDALQRLREVVAERGPITASELEPRRTPKEPWWDWNLTKVLLEFLFLSGEISAVRLGNFARAYVPLDHALDGQVPRRDQITDHQAARQSLLLAARCHGVGTAKDLADYPRMGITAARPILDDLAKEGLLHEVMVKGRKGTHYRHPEAKLPRFARAAALVSPFDSVVWFRHRNEELFDFHYRIEIYTPKPKRIYGYYVLPFLLGERFAARVDLKADRAGRRLLVHSAFAEPGEDHEEVVGPLANELRQMATWLDLDNIEVHNRGDLASALAATVD